VIQKFELGFSSAPTITNAQMPAGTELVQQSKIKIVNYNETPTPRSSTKMYWALLIRKDPAGNYYVSVGVDTDEKRAKAGAPGRNGGKRGNAKHHRQRFFRGHPPQTAPDHNDRHSQQWAEVAVPRQRARQMGEHQGSENRRRRVGRGGFERRGGRTDRILEPNPNGLTQPVPASLDYQLKPEQQKVRGS